MLADTASVLACPADSRTDWNASRPPEQGLRCFTDNDPNQLRKLKVKLEVKLDLKLGPNF
jgi:hypothetical protein